MTQVLLKKLGQDRKLEDFLSKRYKAKVIFTETNFMTAQTNFQKALMLLDRERFEEAEALLIAAINLSEAEGEEVTLGGALCCLGELLYQQDRDDEAIPLLKRVASIERDDDFLNHEIKQASDILQEIRM
jgi:tetratricopeptide (TPR) repeat protein